MKKNRKREKGVELVATIFIMLIVTVMAITIVSLLVKNTHGSVNYMQSQQAFFLAETGIQSALLELSKGGGTWTGWSGTDPKTIQATLTGYGDFDVTVTGPLGPNPQITSTGYVPRRSAAVKAVRVINAVGKKTSYSGLYAIFAGESGAGFPIRMSGGSITDSYNSSKGLYNAALAGGGINKRNNGSVGTNADITSSGGSHIFGNLQTGPYGTFNDTSAISGIISHDSNVSLPPVAVPAALSALPSEGAINLSGSSSGAITGNHKYTSFNFSGGSYLTVTGPADIYLTGSSSINLSGSSSIRVSAASTGPVHIYADGNLNISGGGVINATLIPANFIVFGTSSSSQSISISGGSGFYGTVYAPKGNLNLSGASGMYGSFIIEKVNMSGGSLVHLDEALSSVQEIPGPWTVTNWKEVY